LFGGQWLFTKIRRIQKWEFVRSAEERFTSLHFQELMSARNDCSESSRATWSS